MKRRPELFRGHWVDPIPGERLRRVTREEMREAWRLWVRHRDIREGRVEPKDGSWS